MNHISGKIQPLSRRISVVLLALSALIGLGVAVPATASASGYGCSGTQIDSYPDTTSGGSIYGYVYLYYDSSTGYNCAVNVSTGSLYGVSKSMWVQIEQCSAGTVSGQSCYSATSVSSDPTNGGFANYSYYAGPVSVYGAGHCISIEGAIYSGPNTTGTQAYIHKPPAYIAVHCG